MFSRVAYYLVIFGVLLMQNLIFPVKGQCTVESCETGDSSITIATEIQQMFAEVHERLQAIDRRSQEQLQEMMTLNASIQQMKNQQDTVLTSLQAIDRRSQEQDSCVKQVKNIHQLLNTSVQQMSSFNESLKRLQDQQDAVMRSLQSVTVGQPAQRQDVCIKEVHALLNTSNQQMTNQHTSVMRRLDDVMELLLHHDIYTKNQSQNFWTPAVGSTLQPKTVTDLGNDSTLLPSLNNWTIIMNRFDGSVNFNRSWIEYKNGFGEIGRGEFWLGNEIVHRLTNRSGLTYSLRIEVQLHTSGIWFYADYATFFLDSEASKYAIHLSGYSGNAGDSLTNTSVPSIFHHNGMSFSTYDADNDRWSDNCAQYYGGGWWFNSCYHSHLTCTYSLDAFVWSFTGGWQTSGRLRAARMMIKIR